STTRISRTGSHRPRRAASARPSSAGRFLVHTATVTPAPSPTLPASLRSALCGSSQIALELQIALDEAAAIEGRCCEVTRIEHRLPVDPQGPGCEGTGGVTAIALLDERQALRFRRPLVVQARHGDSPASG